MKEIEIKLPHQSDCDAGSLDCEILAIAAIHLEVLQNMLKRNTKYSIGLSEALEDIANTYKDYSTQVRQIAVK